MTCFGAGPPPTVRAHLPPGTSAYTLTMSNRWITQQKLVLVETSSENTILPLFFREWFHSSVYYFFFYPLLQNKVRSTSTPQGPNMKQSISTPSFFFRRQFRWPPCKDFTAKQVGEMHAWPGFSRDSNLALPGDLGQGRSLPTKWKERSNPLWFWNSEADLTQSKILTFCKSTSK